MSALRTWPKINRRRARSKLSVASRSQASHAAQAWKPQWYEKPAGHVGRVRVRQRALLHDQPYDQQVVYGIHPVGQDKIADVALAGVPGQRQERGEEQEPRPLAQDAAAEPVRSSQRAHLRYQRRQAQRGDDDASRNRGPGEPGERPGCECAPEEEQGPDGQAETDLQRAAQQPVGGLGRRSRRASAAPGSQMRTRQASQIRVNWRVTSAGIYPPTVTESYTKPTWGTWAAPSPRKPLA